MFHGEWNPAKSVRHELEDFGKIKESRFASLDE
jgi:hypothetical protein